MVRDSLYGKENRMITHVTDILNIFHYEVIEGAPHLWTCYGKSARILDFGRGLPLDEDSWTVSVIFDSNPKKGTLFEIIIDYNDKVYRWVNPTYLKKYLAECKSRAVSPSIAYDQVEYISFDLLTIEKFIKMLYKNNKLPM